MQGSHGDLDVVNKAFAGADSVFWVVPPDPRAKSVDAAYVDFTRPACDAFKKHKVKRVVGISALGRGTPAAAHAGIVTASLKMDDLIASTGVSYRAVTNPSFMDNLLRQAELIKNQGMFSLPISGDLKQPSACTRIRAFRQMSWVCRGPRECAGVWRSRCAVQHAVANHGRGKDEG